MGGRHRRRGALTTRHAEARAFGGRKAFTKPLINVPSKFGQSLVEHRLRDFLIVLSLDRSVRLEVEAVGEVVAHGVARGLVLLLPQLHPGPRPTGPPANPHTYTLSVHVEIRLRKMTAMRVRKAKPRPAGEIEESSTLFAW